LYTNIDLKLRNKLPLGVTCVFNGHEIYTLVITQQCSPPHLADHVVSVWSMFPCNIIQ